MLPSAGDDDGISRLVSGAQGVTKHTNTGAKLWKVSQGVRARKRDLLLKFLSLSMQLEMICIHPDRMNVKDLFYFLSLLLPHVDIVMGLRRPTCHTCMQGKRRLHADTVNSFPSLSACFATYQFRLYPSSES